MTVDAVAYGVETDELLATADRLRDAGTAATAHAGSLAQLSDTVDAWAPVHAVQAAHAFLATLAWAAEGTSAGLADLSRRTAAAAGAYDHTERSVPFPR